MRTVSLIASMGTFGQIGLDGTIPWLKDPAFAEQVADAQKKFDSMTRGGVLIMGRKTYNSFLSGSAHGLERAIVVWDSKKHKDPQSLLTACARKWPDRDVWIVGGEKVFEMFVPYCDWHLISQIPYHGPADKYMPVLSPAWQVLDRGGFGRINSYEKAHALPDGMILLTRHGYPVFLGHMSDTPEHEFRTEGTTAFVNPRTYDHIATMATLAAQKETRQ